MNNNHFVVKVTGPGTVALVVGEKLKDLGVRQLSYKSHSWEVETEYSKEDLLESLKRVVADKAQVEITEV